MAKSTSIWPGRYAVHLQRYLDAFPRDRIRVFVYDDYVRAPRETLRDLFQFLGVDPAHPIDITVRHNVTLAPRWPAVHAFARPLTRALRRAMPGRLADAAARWYLSPRRRVPTPEERARAIDVYRDDTRELERLIDRDLSAWLR